MKKLPAAILLGSIAIFAAGCDQQSWEETKMFHQNPTGHGTEAHGAAGHAKESPAGESPAAQDAPAADSSAEQQ